MRLILIILFFGVLSADAQVIKAWNYTAKAVSSSCSYLIDDYTGSLLAYSVRKLSNSYSGNAIRVRRSSDNTEQDIGFSGCYLDTASLKSFVGANSGYIVTWYDQSGNGNNATQSTQARQPRIINSGTVERYNNSVAARFVSGNNRMDISISSTTITNQTIFSVFGPLNTGLSNTRIVSFRKSSASNDFDDYIPIISNGATQTSYGAYIGGFRALITVSTSALNIFCAISNGSTIKNNSNNGTEQTYSYSLNQAVVTYTLGAADLSSGSLNGGFDGYICEAVVYNSDKSSDRSAMFGSINSFYSIY